MKKNLIAIATGLITVIGLAGCTQTEQFTPTETPSVVTPVPTEIPGSTSSPSPSFSPEEVERNPALEAEVLMGVRLEDITVPDNILSRFPDAKEAVIQFLAWQEKVHAPSILLATNDLTEAEYSDYAYTITQNGILSPDFEELFFEEILKIKTSEETPESYVPIFGIMPISDSKGFTFEGETYKSKDSWDYMISQLSIVEANSYPSNATPSSQLVIDFVKGYRIPVETQKGINGIEIKTAVRVFLEKNSKEEWELAYIWAGDWNWSPLEGD